MGGGVRETVTLRKVSFGVGVERILPLHSPRLEKAEIVKRAKVRQAKLYYLRERSGKAARLKELKPKLDSTKKKKIKREGPILLLFGTGWGLEKSILTEADYVLDPVEGVGEYNHLPVRAAIAIILDRLVA